MRIRFLLSAFLVSLCSLAIFSSAFADTNPNDAVKASKVIAATLSDLELIGLQCSMGVDEEGEETIQYLTREVDGVARSTFRAMYPCSNGQSAIFDGVLGDSGVVAVYYFELLYAN